MTLAIDPVMAPDAWLEARRKGIGSSDAAAVLGLDPYRTPLAVWAEKRGHGLPREDSYPMKRGRALEAVILDRAEELLGCGPLARQVFLAHPGRPWQLATLDGLSADGLVVEAKAVGYRSAGLWGPEGTDEVPAQYLCQVQHQLCVAGRDEARIVADVGGEVRVYRVERDERFLRRMVEMQEAFWACVEAGHEPPVTDAADAEVLARLHPVTDAEVLLPPDLAKVIDRYEEFGRVAREAQVAKDLARAELLQALGDAGRGTLPDGRSVVRRLVRRAEHVVKASEFVTLSVKGVGR